MKHLNCAMCAEWYQRNTIIFSDYLKLLLLSTGSRRLSGPDCWTCNREGLMTESAEPVTWYGQVMSSG